MTIKRVTTIDESDGVVIGSKDYKYTIFDNDKGYLFKNKAYYIKGYQGIRLSDVVRNKGDYANVHLLAEHLYKDTNMIAVRRNKKYYPADIRDMYLFLDMCEKRFKEFLDRMMQIGIIAKAVINTKESLQIQYHVNPLYFNTSKYISPALYMMFRKQLDEHLPDWVVRRFNE
jgi:hypothetical protein